MKNNTTIYKPVFESDFIATLDARKELKIQTVIGSNGTATINLLMNFKSDKTDGKGYIKAIAFNVSNDNMRLLVDALIAAQKVLNTEMKKGLSARPQVKEVVALSGNAQIDALRQAGLTDEQISALGIEIPKPAKKKVLSTTVEEEIDIFTQVIALMTPAQLKKLNAAELLRGINGKGGAKGGK